jgi:hypothetical protein
MKKRNKRKHKSLMEGRRVVTFLRGVRDGVDIIMNQRVLQIVKIII